MKKSQLMRRNNWRIWGNKDRKYCRNIARNSMRISSTILIMNWKIIISRRRTTKRKSKVITRRWSIKIKRRKLLTKKWIWINRTTSRCLRIWEIVRGIIHHFNIEEATGHIYDDEEPVERNVHHSNKKASVEKAFLLL
jgi:hypothetical protein